MNCVCGQDDWGDIETREGVTIDPSGAPKPTTIAMVSCRACGVARQGSLPFSTQDEYVHYYQHYPPVDGEYQAKSYAHDQEVARHRCDQSNLFTQKRPRLLLDVGSGSGALVAEARHRGFEAYGCEIASYHDAGAQQWTYAGLFEALNFPTDHFDYVTCYDVLEHSMDPRAMIAELFRVCKQGGQCFVEFPRFYHDSGRHHWKDAEHIWF